MTQYDAGSADPKPQGASARRPELPADQSGGEPAPGPPKHVEEDPFKIFEHRDDSSRKATPFYRSLGRTARQPVVFGKPAKPLHATPPANSSLP